MKRSRRDRRAMGYPMGVENLDEVRRMHCMAVADRETTRLGVRRALDAMDWLGDQTAGLLETRVSVFEVTDSEPMLYLDGHWWIEGVEKRLTGEYVCFASTSKARLRRIAREMLGDYKAAIEAQTAASREDPGMQGTEGTAKGQGFRPD